MEKKKLYQIITILVLVVFLSITLTSCKEWFGQKEKYEDEAMERRLEEEWREKEKAKAEEAEQIAREKQVKLDEAAQEEWEEANAQVEWEEEEAAVAEEEEKAFPNEPITYSGNIDGVPVILIVNFKTTEVTGSISLSGEDYIDAPINGKIDINTFIITSNYSGIAGTKELGEFPFNGTITGIITDDLSTFNGEIQPDYEDTGTKFTATK